MKHVFAPGEHDEFVCKHVLAEASVSGSVEHTYLDDGSVEVDFLDVAEDAVKERIGTYDRAEYEPQPAPALTREEIVKLKQLAAEPVSVTAKV